MNAFLKLGVSTAILASSLVSVPGFEGTPLGVSAAHAEHRDYRRYNRRDRFDVGDAVIGAVVVGGLIAILSGASKKKTTK